MLIICLVALRPIAYSFLDLTSAQGIALFRLSYHPVSNHIWSLRSGRKRLEDWRKSKVIPSFHISHYLRHYLQSICISLVIQLPLESPFHHCPRSYRVRQNRAGQGYHFSFNYNSRLLDWANTHCLLCSGDGRLFVYFQCFMFLWTNPQVFHHPYIQLPVLNFLYLQYQESFLFLTELR